MNGWAQSMEHCRVRNSLNATQEPSLIYKATANLWAVQILPGHANIENTVRYFGVDIDDAMTLAEWTEI